MNTEDVKALINLTGDILKLKFERDAMQIERDQLKQTVEMLREEIKFLRRTTDTPIVHVGGDEMSQVHTGYRADCPLCK